MAAVALVGVVGYAWTTRSSPVPVATGTSQSPTSPHRAPADPGLAISVKIDPAGGLLVDERLDWAPSPGGAPIAFGVPARVSGSGLPEGASVTPRLSMLRLEYDGAVLTPGLPGPQRWSITPRARAGLHRLEATYRVDGTASRSTPAPQGRATVLIVSMLPGVAGDVPITMAVTAPSTGTILALDCPLEIAMDRVCGEHAGAQWTATFAAGQGAEARVVTAQVDLPT